MASETAPPVPCSANFLAKHPLPRPLRLYVATSQTDTRDPSKSRPTPAPSGLYERLSRRSRRLGAATSSAVKQAADQASSCVSAIATTVWPQLAARTHQRPFSQPWQIAFQPRQVPRFGDWHDAPTKEGASRPRPLLDHIPLGQPYNFVFGIACHGANEPTSAVFPGMSENASSPRTAVR